MRGSAGWTVWRGPANGAVNSAPPRPRGPSVHLVTRCYFLGPNPPTHFAKSTQPHTTLQRWPKPSEGLSGPAFGRSERTHSTPPGSRGPNPPVHFLKTARPAQQPPGEGSRGEVKTNAGGSGVGRSEPGSDLCAAQRQRGGGRRWGADVCARIRLLHKDPP